jgi:hypothetical protein
MSLVDTAGLMLMTARFASSQADLITRMQALADELLAKAEPGVERYQQWPLPEAHPLVRMLQEVRLHAAKAAEIAPAAAASGLNMDQLLDFLPAAGGSGGSKAAEGKAAGAAAGAAGKGKGKKKAGGKK